MRCILKNNEILIHHNIFQTLAGVEHPDDLSAGSARKAWESWLIESGLSLSGILASQGHDMNTSMKHHYNNDVTPEERVKMKEMTQGWG